MYWVYWIWWDLHNRQVSIECHVIISYLPFTLYHRAELAVVTAGFRNGKYIYCLRGIDDSQVG